MTKSSVENKIDGTLHEIKGKAKELVGRTTNNPDLEERGVEEKIAGQIERKVGDVKNVFGK